MSNVLKMLSRGGAAAAETDPNFKQTVLLLHGDGTNGAQNNTFLDSSANNFTITRNGNTTQGTFSPFSLAAGEWSNYFDGNGDFLSIAYNAAFDITNANFCVEAWIYRTTSGVEQYLISQRAGNGWEWRINATNLMVFFYTAGSSITSVSTIPVNQWTHVAVTRDGSNVRLFINGVVDATATFSNGTATTSSLRIGYTTDPPAGYFQGYLSNVRVVKGSAVYTSAFTPSTTPLTAITNTSLLTCQSNRFVDNSTNAFAITRNGDVRVTPFSPFAPTAAYSAGTNGGSGYFDGTGDYLTAVDDNALDLGSNNFTIEMWVYPTAFANPQILLAKTATAASYGSYELRLANGTVVMYLSSTGTTWDIAAGVGTGVVILQSWNHIALTRSGSTFTLYVNGVSSGTATSANALVNNNSSLGIGAYPNNQFPITGYLSSLRIVNGTALSITVPTAPLTAITNTSLLLNFTNAGIIDNTGKNNLETVGNAQIDTTTKKYGTGSMKFDGTGDYLVVPFSPAFGFGTGDYTIEFWLNTASTTRYDTPLARWTASNNDAYLFFLNQGAVGSGKISFWVNAVSSGAAFLESTTSVNNSTWHHICVCRASGTTRLFVNGTSEASSTTSYNITNSSGNALWIGTDPLNPTTRDFAGYIDDLRITNGVARYTANFTPPIKELPNQ